MDAGLPASEEDREPDRHGWNSYANYKAIHDKRLAEHHFVNHSNPNTLNFDLFDLDGSGVLEIKGDIYCRYNVVLSVDKKLAVREVGNNLLQVRGYDYCYHAYLKAGRQLLRYDNTHDLDDYHKHVFDGTGKQIECKSLTRGQFPVLSEVLDELSAMFQ